MNKLDSVQAQKIEKIKDGFKAEKNREKQELKDLLKSPDTYDFEKPQLKENYKIQIYTKKKEMKQEITKIKDPEFYKLDTTKRNNEQAILDLQNDYYKKLAKLERNLRKVKKINFWDKSLRPERKEKVLAAKKEIKDYKETQGAVLKNEIEKIEMNNPINKYREFKNTAKLKTQRQYDKAMPKIAKVSNQKHLISLRNAFSAIIPLVIVASVLVVILNIPTSFVPTESWWNPDAAGGAGAWETVDDGIKRYLSEYMPQKLVDGFNIISSLTMGVMSVALAVALGINLAEQYGESQAMGGMMGFAGFIMWMDVKDGGMLMSGLGASGLFGAIITSIFMFEMYRIFNKYHITIKLPKAVPAAVADSFLALIPTTVYAALVVALRFGAEINIVTGLGSLFGAATGEFTKSMGLICLIVFINSASWWVGIHGSTFINFWWVPMSTIAMGENQQWWNNGHVGQVPHEFSDQFLVNMVYIGGAGALLGFGLVALIFAKSKQNKALARSTTVPAIFNITEPILFGYPIVLNIYMMIPFILTPVVLVVVTGLLSRAMGLVWIAAVPWTMPAPLAAFLSSGNNWKALVLSLLAIVISMAMYYPFFKFYDKIMVNEEREKAAAEAKAKGITLREMLIQEAQEKQQKKLAKKQKKVKANV